MPPTNRTTALRQARTIAQLRTFLENNVGRKAPLAVQASVGRLLPTTAKRRLLERGIISPTILAERAIDCTDVAADARELGFKTEELLVLYDAAKEHVGSRMCDEFRRDRDLPHGFGQINPDSEEALEESTRLGLKPATILDSSRMQSWEKWNEWTVFLPLMTNKAVDMRPFFTPARSQGGRGTCAAFGSTAVVEALEYLRDRRPGPRNLAEQGTWWLIKGGQLYSAGGASSKGALSLLCQYGTAEEPFYPYHTSYKKGNHTQVPAPDTAIDRAQFYRGDEVLKLAFQDIDELKAVLSTGRCVVLSSPTKGWKAGTGVYEFPNPLDQSLSINHSVTVIGFVDHPDVPDLWEGGFFIIRNSHARAHSTTNLMGPEYGGHLRMPYGFYRRYCSNAFTLADEQRTRPVGRTWLAEYFDNKTLRGVPKVFEEIEGELDFNWNGGSPHYDIPNNDFSARFTQHRRLRPGWYRFELTGDDGIRLWIDDRLLINRWHNQPTTKYTRDFHLSGGDHLFRVEFYEKADKARLKLQITPVEFQYTLFTNTSLSGAGVKSFKDTSNVQEWRQLPPVMTSASNGRFSLRAKANVKFWVGRYRFHSVHTGGCRIWLDGEKVLEDWNGTDPTGPEIDVSSGLHEVVVEFKHMEEIPALDSHTTYRAALNFGWSEVFWNMHYYEDLGRKTLFEMDPKPAGWSYEGYRTECLTGKPELEIKIASDNNTTGEYLAVDGIPLTLHFDKTDMFKNVIPGTGSVQTKYMGVLIQRLLFIPETGRYTFRYEAKGGARLIVDGRQLVQKQRSGAAVMHEVDLDLEMGVHDLAMEYGNTKWGAKLNLDVERTEWNVTFYTDEDLGTVDYSTTVDRLDSLMPQLVADGRTHFSLKAEREYLLPPGRYRAYVRGNDGVRLHVDGKTIISAWKKQGTTGYSTTFEHPGGSVMIGVDYYQEESAMDLNFDLQPDGFFGEYYRGIQLNEKTDGASMKYTMPVAYRYENWVDFDWGRGGHLSRVGPDNFSARWWGRVNLPTGRWTFKLTVNNAVRLYVDGRIVIDNWDLPTGTEHSVTLDLVARTHDLLVEYYEKTVDAFCQLRLERVF